MDDLISRQAAIDLWDKYHPYIATEAMEYDRELRALPSARPERKKGKWEMKWHPFFHIEVPMCSVCKNLAACKIEVCPHCGADMREEKNDVGSEV